MRIASDSVTVEILARPGSPRRGVLRVDARGLVIGLASPPENNRANDELVALITGIAGVLRNNVSILRGATSRLKVVRIDCVRAHPEAVAQRIISMAAKHSAR